MGKQLKCKGCDERFPGCHGICPYYLKFREEHEREYARKREEVERGIKGYEIEREFKKSKARSKWKK